MCSAVFAWDTSALCGDASAVECVATDAVSGLRYDLSSLSRSEGWLAIDYEQVCK